jgi:hypothetical protein
VLDDVADAVAQGRPPAPLPDFAAILPESEAPTEDPASPDAAAPQLQAQLRWVARQLTVLHGAASRRSAPPTEVSSLQP